jgi:hypothetical protein
MFDAVEIVRALNEVFGARVAMVFFDVQIVRAVHRHRLSVRACAFATLPQSARLDESEVLPDALEFALVGTISRRAEDVRLVNQVSLPDIVEGMIRD